MNYKSLLYEIQATTLHPGPGLDVIVVPSNTQLYNVDLTTRTIDAPQNLSVKTEHYAETVYFLVDRFFDNMDLAQTNCVVQYVTKEGAFIYNVPFCDTTTFGNGVTDDKGNIIDPSPKMIIPWSVSGFATKQAGQIKYAIRFYMIDESSVLDNYGAPTRPENAAFSYSLSTKAAISNILDTISDSNDFVIDEHSYHIEDNAKYFELINTINQMVDNSTIYWIDV